MTIEGRALVLSLVLALSGSTGCSLDGQGNRVLGVPGFGNSALYVKPDPAIGINDRSDVISKYFSQRQLMPIEGVWVWNNNQYEVAILRNNTEHYKDYDYVGAVTETRADSWGRGQIKLLLRETASPQAYSGIYFDGNHREIGTMFFLTSQNLIEFALPDFYGTQRTILVRTFPKDSQSRSIADTDDASGTGFFVTQDIVATNYHVIREAKQIALAFGGITVPGELLLKDSQNDLALLRIITSPNSPTMPIALKGLRCLAIGDADGSKAGDHAFTIGFPLSGVLSASPSVAQGLISNSSGIDNDPRMFQISIPIQAGNSGSPLLDSNGKVIGVITSTLDAMSMLRTTGSLPQNVNFAIKSSYLKSILAMVPSNDCEAPVLSKQPLTARDIQDLYGLSVVLIRAARKGTAH